MYAVKSEGMFPYETHYVLATDEEVERLYERGRAMDEQSVQWSGMQLQPVRDNERDMTSAGITKMPWLGCLRLGPS